MGRPIKKLQKSDINKNSSSQVSHSIKKIKEHEARYTTLLVIGFMALFCVIGYFTLRVNNDTLLNNVQKVEGDYGLSLSSSVVTLSSTNIMGDEEGLLTPSYYLNVDNRSSNDLYYRIKLVEDKDISESCGCESIPLDQIRFSFDENQSQSLGESQVIGEAFLMSHKQKKLQVKVWLDSSVDSSLDQHFHGHFVIERQ